MGWPTLNGDTSSGMSQSFKHRRKPMLAELQIPDRGGHAMGIDITPSMLEAIAMEDEAESPKAPAVEAAQDVAVQVFLRVRAHPQAPASKVVTVRDRGNEHESSSSSFRRMGTKVEIDGRSFRFNAGGDEAYTQAELFECVGRPVCNSVMNGYNGTIFAYGQTGSGKTHTMMGPLGGPSNDPERGLTPRVLEEVFLQMARRQLAASAEGKPLYYRCSCSYLQVYNDTIT